MASNEWIRHVIIVVTFRMNQLGVCVISVKNQKEKKFRDKISRQMALLDSVDRWRWQRRKETGPPANELGPTISQWRTLLLVTQVRLTKYGTCCLHFLRFQSETQSHLAEPPVPPPGERHRTHSAALKVKCWHWSGDLHWKFMQIVTHRSTTSVVERCGTFSAVDTLDDFQTLRFISR